MKRFTIIILILLLLCSCTETSQQNEIKNNTRKIIYENFTVEETDNENGTTAKLFDLNGNQIGTDYQSVSEIDKILVEFLGHQYYVGTITDKTRLEYIPYMFDPYFEKVEEVPNTKNYILNENGYPLVEIPFEHYNFSEKDTVGNEGFDAFYGFVDGDKYCYEIKDNKFIYRYTKHGGETGNEYFGFKETVYYYDIGMYIGYGFNDSDGNIIMKPVHSRIDFPCKDRLIIYAGYVAHNSYPDEHMAYITDIDGNILASYSYIKFFDFENGYIWLAYYSGDDNHSLERFGKEKGFLEGGYRFIDKDGNELSPCYKRLSVNGEEDYTIESPDDIITAIDENGNTVEFTAREYLCKE